jgi:hypothetical protein
MNSWYYYTVLPGQDSQRRDDILCSRYFRIARFWHGGRQGEPGPHRRAGQIIPPREDQEEAQLLPGRPH